MTQAQQGRGFRARPPTPRPLGTVLADGEDEEDEVDEGVGEDDDDRELREPGQVSEAELDEHIARGDLTVLADLVLNGEGDRLLNKNARHPEVQSFLDHVPTYMVRAPMPNHNGVRFRRKISRISHSRH